MSKRSAPRPNWMLFRHRDDATRRWGIRSDPPFVDEWLAESGAPPAARCRRLRSADERQWRMDDRTEAREEAGFVPDGELASGAPGAPTETAVDQARASIREGKLSSRDDERLLAALQKGDRAKLDALLATKLDANVEYPPHGPAFHTILALYNGADVVDLVRTMLARGADPNLRDERERTPLHVVAARAIGPRAPRPSDPDLVHLLVATGADVAARDEDGLTPLHVQMAASGVGTELVAAALLDAGAPVDARDQHGATALHAAIASGAGSLARVKLLVDRGSDARAELDGCSPLELARSMRSHPEGDAVACWLEDLLGEREAIDDPVVQLAEVVREGPFSRISSRSDPTSAGAERAAPQTLRLLGERTASAPVEMLRTALEARGVDVARLRTVPPPLPRARVARIDATIAAAVTRGRLGARAEATRVDGRTLVDVALDLDMLETVRALATVSGRSKQDLDRWLQKAVADEGRGDPVELVRILLEAGADPFAIVHQSGGVFAAPMLQSAARLGHRETVRALIERCSDAPAMREHAELALPGTTHGERDAQSSSIGALLRRAHRAARGEPRGPALVVKPRKQNRDPETTRGIAPIMGYGAQFLVYFVRAPAACVAEVRARGAARWHARAEEATVPWGSRWDAIVEWRGNPWTVVIPAPVPRSWEAESVARALGARVLAVGPAAAIELGPDGRVVYEEAGDVDAWCAARGAFMCAFERATDGLRLGLVLRGVWPEVVQRFDIVVHEDDSDLLDARDREVLVALESRLSRT